MGNTYSTFSKAVALLRAPRAVSWAYDCAPIERALWTLPKGRQPISVMHPGFAHTRPLEPERCGYSSLALGR